MKEPKRREPLRSWGDREYWKWTYFKHWPRHAEKVKRLHGRLKKKFPQLTIKPGLGSETGEWLKMPPDQRGGPDLTLYHEYEILCYIEVTGSDKINVPQELYVRPDKLNFAEMKGEKFWFYLEYKNGVRILDAEVVRQFKSNIVSKDWYGKWERYISAPCAKSYPESEMFDWIEREIKAREAGVV